MNSKLSSSVAEILQKLEYYCSYQERCHVEVREKLRQFDIKPSEKEQLIVTLIATNFLNEERYACLFAISKFHQKKWGRNRIKMELKSRQISDYLIAKALKGIPNDAYFDAFEVVSVKFWEGIGALDFLKRRKKFCDYMLRKGWESDWVYEKVKQLEGANLSK